MPNASAIAGHTLRSVNTSPLVMLKVWYARRRLVRGPLHRLGEQVGVHCLDQRGDATGVVQRLACLAEQRGVHAERRDGVHVAAHRLAEDEDRPPDREAELVLGLLLAQEVLLQPVEVGVRVPRRPLAARAPASARRAPRTPSCPAGATRAQVGRGLQQGSTRLASIAWLVRICSGSYQPGTSPGTSKRAA